MNQKLFVYHLFFLATLLFFASGCTSVVKGLVDTQPKVNFEDQDYDNPENIVQGEPVFYEVDLGESEFLDTDLKKYAPILVQGFQHKQDSPDQYSYNYSSDGIGSPGLSEDGKEVYIETNQPSAFCRVEYTEVLGTKLKQLVYVFWYPERPLGSLETGKIDGNILRITLDAAGYPAIFEYSQTCGCFHGIFVGSHIEAEASNEFVTPLEGKNYVVEKKLSQNTDWLVRDLIDVVPEERPILFISAGTHFCHAIRFSHQIKKMERYTSQSYKLFPYDNLLKIPKKNGGVGSMFNEEGLVIGGKRWKEEIFLSSLKNPGWPRHLDYMLIHWDESSWNDPKLLEEHLRLPKKILSTEPKKFVSPPNLTSRQKYSESPSLVPSQICGVCDSQKPYILIFTHKFCPTCRSFKNDVLPLSQVQSVLKGWNCILIDMSEEKNKQLADTYRVDVTPTFLAFNQFGKEINRTSHLDSDVKFIAYLNACFSKDQTTLTNGGNGKPSNETMNTTQPSQTMNTTQPSQTVNTAQPSEVVAKPSKTVEKPSQIVNSTKPSKTVAKPSEVITPTKPLKTINFTISTEQKNKEIPSISFQKFPTPKNEIEQQTDKILVEEIRTVHPNGKPFAILFTHKMCLGCQQLKKSLLHSTQAQSALKDWNYVVLDMYEPKNAKIGELYHIEITPSLVLFASDGKIIERMDDIESVDKFMAFLSRHKN